VGRLYSGTHTEAEKEEATVFSIESMEESMSCPFCDIERTPEYHGGGTWRYTCPKCGSSMDVKNA